MRISKEFREAAADVCAIIAQNDDHDIEVSELALEAITAVRTAKDGAVDTALREDYGEAESLIRTGWCPGDPVERIIREGWAEEVKICNLFAKPEVTVKDDKGVEHVLPEITEDFVLPARTLSEIAARREQSEIPFSDVDPYAHGGRYREPFERGLDVDGV